MNYFGKKLFLLFLVTTLLSMYVTSQSKNDSVKVLDEITVTDNISKNKTRSSSPLQIITNTTFNQLNAHQVSDAVKYFSGVVVKDYGGIGGLKTVSVRSLGANHTIIAYDGIAISDVQTGQIDIGRFSLENVDLISLNNGQSDNIFQPARLFSSASAINIKTLAPKFEGKKSITGNLLVRTGSLGLINPSFSFNKKINKAISTSFSSEFLYANGEYPYKLYYGNNERDSFSLERRKNTDVRNLRLEGTVYGQFNSTNDGYIKMYYYSSQRGLPGATIYYNTENFSSQRIWDNTFFVQAHYMKHFSEKCIAQANIKFNAGNLRYLDPTTLNSAGETENKYLQQEFYTSLSAIYKVYSQLSFSASTDLFTNKLNANLTDFQHPTRLTSLSVIAGKFVTNSVLATSSLLYTLTNEQVRSGNPAKNQQKISPYFSISLKPFSEADLRLRFFYKNIFRLPTFNDLYYSRIGNNNLKPENANQFNGGLTYNKETLGWMKHVSFTLDAYRNLVTNKIVAYPTKNIFQWTMLNYGKVAISGVDIATETALKLATNTQLILSYAHSYQRSLQVTNPQDRDYKHQIPYTPRVSGSGRATLETKWGDFNYSMLWSGHRYAVNQNYAENRVEGYTDHNISVSKQLKTKLGIISGNAEILNLLNKNYEVVRFFPMPGRTFRVSFSLKF